jgi:hypothetical protein
VLQDLGTAPHGLDTTEVERRLKAHGPNRLAEAPANTAKEQTVSTGTFLIEHLLVEQSIVCSGTCLSFPFTTSLGS